MKARLLCLCPLLLLILVVVNASAKDKSVARVYSDVRIVEEDKDLAGTELELKIDGNAVTGVVRIYDGGCAESVPVLGSSSGDTIRVSGEGQGFGKIEITGKLEHGRFQGSLRLDRLGKSEKIRLKKISKRHC
jgi:hypothetical protein